MILTRTPLRISLAGGGTDMPAFYMHQFGAVLSFTIDKYIYIGLNRKFDGRTRVSYSETETVDDIGKLRHDLARACLSFFETSGVEVTSVSDIPGEGSGLGSSSAYTVGLVKSLAHYKNQSLNTDTVAELAFEIERVRCNHPVGKQDHWAAAVGGLNYYVFHPNSVVEATPLPIAAAQCLQNNLMLFYTGVTRQSSGILRAQENKLRLDQSTQDVGLKMRDLVFALYTALHDGNCERVGPIMHECWELKKTLADGISSPKINEWYDKALDAGATGGKVCGAGGGGFMVFYAPQECQAAVEHALPLERIPFKITLEGSRVVYYG